MWIFEQIDHRTRFDDVVGAAFAAGDAEWNVGEVFAKDGDGDVDPRALAVRIDESGFWRIEVVAVDETLDGGAV